MNYTTEWLERQRTGASGASAINDQQILDSMIKDNPSLKDAYDSFSEKVMHDKSAPTRFVDGLFYGGDTNYSMKKQKTEKKEPPELTSVQPVQSQGLMSSLKERNRSAFGSDTGLLQSALNPVATSETDSAAGRLLRGEQGLGQTAFDIAGQSAGAVGDVIGAGVSKVVKGADWLSGGLLSKGAEAVAESEVGQFVGQAAGDIAEQYAKFKQSYPEAARNLENTVNIASLIPMAKGMEVAGDVLIGTPKVISKAAKSVTNKLFGQLDDVAKAGAPEKTMAEALKNSGAASSILDEAEASKAAVGWREKIAGVRPDIKKRIAGKQDKLKEYFDIAHARNLDDTVPTPLEYGSRSVETARDELQKVMNDTGGKIGQFRQKIATVKVGIDDMNNIENTFNESLRGMNLEIRNGGIVRTAGKVAGKVSDSEVKTLQGIYDDILRVKSAPSSENLIDLRNAIQDKINFAKSAKEASNVVDPLARKVRSTIRDVNLKMIGKSQGQLLDDYSDLAEVLKDMNTFVESKTGGEFLLKRVLSERGRVPREVMSKVREYTGIDLMDDATMAQLATEIIGNAAQKGLFRQEITKAGLDAMDIIDVLTGSPGGTVRATKALMQPAKDLIAPVEKTFLKAAQ